MVSQRLRKRRSVRHCDHHSAHLIRDRHVIVSITLPARRPIAPPGLYRKWLHHSHFSTTRNSWERLRAIRPRRSNTNAARFRQPEPLLGSAGERTRTGRWLEEDVADIRTASFHSSGVRTEYGYGLFDTHIKMRKGARTT